MSANDYFSDEEIAAAKKTFPPGDRVHALLARLELAEAIALAVQNAEALRQGIDITNKASVASDLIEWFRVDWGHVLHRVSEWRRAVRR